jgi:hypothetical protein
MAGGSLWNCGGLHSYWGECKESVIWQGAVCGIVVGCIVTGQSVRTVKYGRGQSVELWWTA